MLKNPIIFLFLVLWIGPHLAQSQEVTKFKVADFDLKGNVKSCLVSTVYGKEEYQFDVSGRLIEAVTRYNEQDYDLTLYTYKNNELLEKRNESYRGNQLDKATSIANFYTYDSTKNRQVTEKIITYEKDFLEQYQYQYTSDQKLSKIVRTNNDGIDETAVVYYEDDDGATANYILNRETQKSVRTKIDKQNDSILTKTITTKKFLEGIPDSTIEEVYNTNGKLVSTTAFSYNEETKKFYPLRQNQNSYDEYGNLVQVDTKVGNEQSSKSFIYQYDAMGNWIKQIITPDNSYKTRKISYYETKDSAKDEE